MGTVKTMTERKLEVTKQRLRREIERLGIDITIHRQGYVSDGSNGYIPSGTITYNVKGILKSLSSAQTKVFTPTDGGRTYTIAETLSVLFEDGVHFEMFDWFIHNGMKYTILQVSNVGEQNLYWLLGLALEPQEVKKYGE